MKITQQKLSRRRNALVHMGAEKRGVSHGNAERTVSTNLVKTKLVLSRLRCPTHCGGKTSCQKGDKVSGRLMRSDKSPQVSPCTNRFCSSSVAHGNEENTAIVICVGPLLTRLPYLPFFITAPVTFHCTSVSCVPG